MEAVTTVLLESNFPEGKGQIPHVSLESAILQYVPTCFKALDDLGVRPPVLVLMTCIGVRGLRMAMGPASFDRGNEIRDVNLAIPGAVVEHFSAPISAVLKPMFDRIWNACGLLKSQNFDDQGNWIGR